MFGFEARYRHLYIKVVPPVPPHMYDETADTDGIGNTSCVDLGTSPLQNMTRGWSLRAADIRDRGVSQVSGFRRCMSADRGKLWLFVNSHSWSIISPHIIGTYIAVSLWIFLVRIY